MKYLHIKFDAEQTDEIARNENKNRKYFIVPGNKFISVRIVPHCNIPYTSNTFFFYYFTALAVNKINFLLLTCKIKFCTGFVASKGKLQIECTTN